MGLFADETTRQIHQLGFAPHVPKHIGRRARRICQLLLAAAEWQDVGMIDRIARFESDQGRYGLVVEGKWFVTFAWVDDSGVTDLSLERR